MKLKELDCLGMKITQTCCDELSEPANTTRDRIIYPCGSSTLSKCYQTGSNSDLETSQ